MKRALFLLFTWVFVLSTAYASEQLSNDKPANEKSSGEMLAKGEMLDSIVATYGDKAITRAELDRRVNILKKQLNQASTPIPNDVALRKQMLEHMIDEGLEMDVAKLRNLKIEDKNLDDAMLAIARQNSMDLAEFRAVLAKEGFKYDEFRNDLRQEMTISKLQQKEINPLVTVSDREIDNMLKQTGTDIDSLTEYRVNSILIALPENPNSKQVEEAMEKANTIIAAAKKGGNFQQLAVEQSDSAEALSGGDLGYRKVAELPSAFADLVPKMAVGDIRGPIRSDNGFHIIQLSDKKYNTETRSVHQTHARHILITSNQLTSEAKAKEMIFQLYKKLKQGQDFATLAKAYSEDYASGSQGGDLGWTAPGAYEPTFEKVMGKLKSNEFSAPFKTPFGWHIVEVLARRNLDQTEAFHRQQAAQLIHNRKYQEALETWLLRLRGESHIVIRLSEQEPNN